MAGEPKKMSQHTTDKDVLTMALTEHGLVVTDLVWAMEWLNSLTDDLNTLYGQGYHPRTVEFLEELTERRKVKTTLNSVAREVGL
jgi:hypothetical protein